MIVILLDIKIKILVNISLKVIDLSKNITNFNKEFYKYFKIDRKQHKYNVILCKD